MTRRAPPPWALPGLALMYIGMILGVSFVAVPAKFLARSIDLAEALDVGRQTFRVFGWVELACASVLMLLALSVRQKPLRRMAAIVLVLVGAQILLVRPPLDKRVDLIMQGADIGSSNLHTVYGTIELGKLTVLLTIAWMARPRSHEQSATARRACK